MGLDINVYKGLELVEEIKDFGDYSENFIDSIYYEPNKTILYDNGYEVFENWQDDLVRGVYTYEDQWHFHAGSYGGYNLRRNSLSRAAFGVEANEVWENWDKYRDVNGVAYLINFTDCDGLIGPQTAAKILDGLNKIPISSIDLWELNEYDFLPNFKKACEDASQNGAIVFC